MSDWSQWYYLVDKVPVQCKTIDDIKRTEETDKRVAFDTIDGNDVSTVFLRLNHAWGDGPPLLFETMVFGGELDQEQERCSTWAEAEEMHARMCNRVREASTRNRHGRADI